MSTKNRNKKIRKNIHIEILKYAQKHIEFRMQSLMDDLKFNQNEKDLFCQDLIHSRLLLSNTGREEATIFGKESIFTISTEGRFRLLDHQQLWWAKFLSILAICFSIVMAICTTYIQLTNSITIAPEQFQEFKEITKELKSVNTDLKDIILKQSDTEKLIENIRDLPKR